MKRIKNRNVILILTILLGQFYLQNTFGQDKQSEIQLLSQQILNDSSSNNKLINHSLLLNIVKNKLNEDKNNIQKLDSSSLVYELISEDEKIQILTWAVLFHDTWEYYGFIKSYNHLKNTFEIFELTPNSFIEAYKTSTINKYNYWPAGVYLRMIETNYNKKKYYTLFGWIAKKDQTSYRFIEVLTINNSGTPTFGKSSFFLKNKEHKNRILFGYNSESSFQLDYGDYSYITKEWNAKKRKFDIITSNEKLIIFDHLISMYPDLKDFNEFLVPSGNVIDAFKFKKGKWVMIKDIDARNMKRQRDDNDSPALKLFPE